MIKKRKVLNSLIALTVISILAFEKIKLSWEISTLYNNNEILRIEFENLKDFNLKLITQFNIENSPANIEKIAKESLKMKKKRPKEISNEK
tara:strand:+ start:238 stop:510 length:273 start_codon:yes stop_codon:yes gene_type:complete